jgi:hypothetical protein
MVAQGIGAPEVAAAVREAFMHGFHTACFTGAGVALFGALFALKFLPARKTTVSA